MLISAIVAGMLLAASPLQQTGSSPQTMPGSESTLDDVLVEGRSIEQQSRSYVEEIAAPPGSQRLASWDRRLCVGLTGLDARYAQYLLDRISAVAASVGLDPGDPGCRPDVLIAFTREPDVVAQAWVQDDLDLFRPSRHGGTDLGAEALERFKVTDAPIRWWHVSLSVNAATGTSVTRTRGEGTAPNFIHTPSRIQSQTRERLIRAFVIVDAEQIGQVAFGSLADYLALVALTQVDPEADTGRLDTVLNLFAGQPAARLSGWDNDYLQALYRMPVNPIYQSGQSRRLASGLADRRASDADSSEQTN